MLYIILLMIAATLFFCMNTAYKFFNIASPDQRHMLFKRINDMHDLRIFHRKCSFSVTQTAKVFHFEDIHIEIIDHDSVVYNICIYHNGLGWLYNCSNKNGLSRNGFKIIMNALDRLERKK